MNSNKSRWAALLVLCISLFLCGPALADSPNDFSGTYSNDKLTLQLHRQGDGYTGDVRMGQQQFPLTAAASGDGLKGTFTSGTDSYDCTITMSGKVLTFATGHASYQLNAPRNPLEDDNAQPPAPPAPAPASAPPATKSGDPAGKWASDGNNPGGKFTLTLGKDGSTAIEVNGSSSSMDGTTLSANAITFSGSVSMNDLSIGGTWKLKWLSPDSFKATDDNGKTYTMTRIGAASAPPPEQTPGPQNFTPTTSVSPSAPAEVTNPAQQPAIDLAKLVGVWRMTKGSDTITMNFKSDGTCTDEDSGDKESGTWKLKGNVLSIIHPDHQTPPQDMEEKMIVLSVDDRHLALSAPDESKTITLDRVQP